MESLADPSHSQPADNPHGPNVQRLSKPLRERIEKLSLVSCSAGFALGALHGSRMAGLRFRAENAHRLPTNERGWYLYHKSKTWAVFRASAKEGGAMGARLGAWTAIFIALEEGVDRGRLRLRESWEGRAQRDVGSTVLAGMGTAGAFSLWSRLPWTTMARMVKLGGVGGLCFGLAQDAMTLAQGHRLAYVDFILRLTGFASGKSQKTTEHGVT